jgi:probable addiction module antidote protein
MSRTKAKSKIKTIPWDSAAYLKTDKDIAHYLEAVFEDGDPSLVAAALGDVARAKGMAQIAKAAGLGRESLYKALSPEGNPEFATVLRVMRALGLKLEVAAELRKLTRRRQQKPSEVLLRQGRQQR